MSAKAFEAQNHLCCFLPLQIKKKHENPNLSPNWQPKTAWRGNNQKKSGGLSFQILQPFGPKFLQKFHPINGHLFLEKKMHAKRLSLISIPQRKSIRKDGGSCTSKIHLKLEKQKQQLEEGPKKPRKLNKKTNKQNKTKHTHGPLHICLLPSPEHLLPHLPKVMRYFLQAKGDSLKRAGYVLGVWALGGLALLNSHGKMSIMLLTAQILRGKPVEVGSWNLPLFTRFFYIPGGFSPDFWLPSTVTKTQTVDSTGNGRKKTSRPAWLVNFPIEFNGFLETLIFFSKSGKKHTSSIYQYFQQFKNTFLGRTFFCLIQRIWL